MRTNGIGDRKTVEHRKITIGGLLLQYMRQRARRDTIQMKAKQKSLGRTYLDPRKKGGNMLLPVVPGSKK